MSDTRKEVFIQNLKDTTTVLQQLRVCIEAVKSLCDDIDVIDENTNHLYQHTIILSYSDSEAEEPDEDYIKCCILSKKEAQYTIDTLKNDINHIRRIVNNINTSYDSVNHIGSSYLGAIRLTDVDVRLNLQDEIYVSINYYDNDALEHHVAFTPNYVGDSVVKIF